VTSLIECIPNISEGRSAALVREIGEPFRRVRGVALLHTHSDPDHHRSVFTVAGEPEPLFDALVAMYRNAVGRIDMRSHRGVHPRLGAVDVCPLVPLPAHGSDLGACIAMASRLGEAVAAELGLPVILYGAAASSPARADLTAVRRGQFEGLADKLALAEWCPDFGLTAPHPTAGATVIGARGPLVAYNVVLDTDDVALARRVAARVRASSGGLPAVKAMGVPLASRGLVQVAMNLEDPALTPVHVAVEAVRTEAAGLGVGLLETELVGLMPLASLAAAAADRLVLPSFSSELVLEQAIFQAFARCGAGTDRGRSYSTVTSEGSIP
jgi:glutamate formiminotransferase